MKNEKKTCLSLKNNEYNTLVTIIKDAKLLQSRVHCPKFWNLLGNNTEYRSFHLRHIPNLV
ncbi:hypothetical protein DERP_006761 [Dermatophagoides pteronyssinus]|uniref:Uncharacterized protein n=1 Tax=Dermatophagoides pteronyssinus TaxID=6956 RepID=A0ABQ8IRX6_DERPT|nr:hypothetical protein DERP_006761 [Dermatophagoides pteronyssinus]